MPVTPSHPIPRPPGEVPLAGEEASVHLSEVLSALSYALDLTEGQAPGHTLRACLLGMRIAEQLALGAQDRSALYYALLLKDAGCSANSAATAELFGSDEHLVKRVLKTTDWQRRLDAAWYVFRTAAAGQPLRERLRHVARVAQAPGGAREMFRIRCERGASIASHLGFPEATAEAIRSLDEHWNGAGHPEGRRGEAIPLLARIANLAQTLEVFFQQGGPELALGIARQRQGTWFDPELVRAACAALADRSWWETLAGPEVSTRVAAAEPETLVRQVDAEGLDTVAGAFAEIIDAKSPYTYRHSSGVAGYARAIAARLGLAPADRRTLYRAGLLHDIGKLGVSNRILDKPGQLTPEERSEIARHPVYTWEILARVRVFAPFAGIASVHHERLDGSGYPWGISAERLDPSARILAVADVYEALTADRPYRSGMPPEQAFGILRREAGSQLDPEAVSALAVLVEENDPVTSGIAETASLP